MNDDTTPPVRHIRAWREGWWYFVSLDGELVFKRHTRDEAFTHALVCFYDNRSPAVPKSRSNFRGVELRGGWRLLRRGPASGFSNSVEVEIRRGQ